MISNKCLTGFVIGLILLGLFHCSKKSPTETGNGDLILEEIEDVLPNPFKGFVPWIGNQNPVYDTKLQYKTFEWRDIEPQKGVFNWTYFEQGWGNISQTGRRVGFRISACTPGSGNVYDIPDWLVNEGVKLRPYTIDGQQGLAPDWDDPIFLQAHQNMIEALGVRYNQDNRVAWIDIGSYGFWGEWHVYLNDSLAATQSTKQTILDDYFYAFPDKPKVIAFDDNFATKYVTDRGGGIRNDCLGTTEANNWYLESLN
ncbi:MAG: beta-galactosidase, partial [bacterium]